MNYKVIGHATGLDHGKVYTDSDILEKKHLGGISRLLNHKVIQATDEGVSTAPEDDPRAAHNNTGSPPPLSAEPGKEEEARIQRMGGGDAAEKANPPTGEPGTVAKAKVKK